MGCSGALRYPCGSATTILKRRFAKPTNVLQLPSGIDPIRIDGSFDSFVWIFKAQLGLQIGMLIPLSMRTVLVESPVGRVDEFLVKMLVSTLAWQAQLQELSAKPTTGTQRGFSAN